jgi:hypothetical protein
MSSPTSPTPPSANQSTTPQVSSENPSSPDSQTDFNIGEEYGTARKNLPPWKILAICIGAVIVIVAAYTLTHRAHPLSSGSIDDVVAVSVPGQDMVMVAINVSVQDNSTQASRIHSIQVAVETSVGKYTDDAAPAVDAQRYFQAFPDLKQHALNILTTETKLNPGIKVTGTVVASFPITADAFAARKSLSVTIAPYDEVPLVLTK